MGGGMGSMLYIIMLVAVFWFLLIRPQQAQAKKRAEMLTALKTGDKVVTIGGICGKVAQITDNKIFVEVSDGIVVEFLRNAISTVEVELLSEILSLILSKLLIDSEGVGF